MTLHMAQPAAARITNPTSNSSTVLNTPEPPAGGTAYPAAGMAAYCSVAMAASCCGVTAPCTLSTRASTLARDHPAA